MSKKIFIVLAATVMTACATKFGQPFRTQELRSLQPGVSTRGEALNIINGTPQSSETYTIKKDTSGKDLPRPYVVEENYYYYRDTKATGSQVDPEAKQYAWLKFSNDKLLGYYFSSTFSNESTDFNENNISKIVKGKTTQAEIRAMFGQPSGQAAYPLAKEPNGMRWYYRTDWWEKSRMHAKLLKIDFDKALTVVDFDLTINNGR